MVLALACSPRFPDRAEMAGMKLTISVYTWPPVRIENERTKPYGPRVTQSLDQIKYQNILECWKWASLEYKG